MLERDSLLLLDRLRLDSAEAMDWTPLPAKFLRKYIAYARKYVNPRYHVDHFSFLSTLSSRFVHLVLVPFFTAANFDRKTECVCPERGKPKAYQSMEKDIDRVRGSQKWKKHQGSSCASMFL